MCKLIRMQPVLPSNFNHSVQIGFYNYQLLKLPQIALAIRVIFIVFPIKMLLHYHFTSVNCMRSFLRLLFATFHSATVYVIIFSIYQHHLYSRFEHGFKTPIIFYYLTYLHALNKRIHKLQIQAMITKVFSTYKDCQLPGIEFGEAGQKNRLIENVTRASYPIKR